MPKWIKGFGKGTVTVVKEFLADNGMNVAAAIAYYTLQSIIPLILGIIVIGSFFLQQGSARTDFINAVKGALPSNTGIDIGKIIDQLSSSAPGLLSVSAIFLLWSGSGIFDQLIFGVNVAYDVKKDNRNFFVKTGLRIGLLLVLGVLIAAAFTVTFLIQLLLNANVSLFGISPKNFSFILPVVSYLIPLVLMWLVFTILYKVAPDRKDNKWRYVMIGALVAAILFEILQYGFTFYVTSFGAANSYQKSYGALGGILLFLLYIWLSACVMLFGAEVASVMGGWKSVMDGPASQQDPGERVDAERIDSDAGPVVTEKEKRQGEARPEPANPEDDKHKTPGGKVPGFTGAGSDKSKPKDRIPPSHKGPVLPGYAVSAHRYPAQRDNSNPVTLVVGSIVLGIAALIGMIFKRRDPAS